jgi:FeS assembly SUF system protein
MDMPKKLVPLDTSKLPGSAPTPSPTATEQSGSLEDRVLAALKTCYDPELPVNIVELGLIYELKVQPSGDVGVQMTLTSPGCPVADSLVREIRSKIEAVAGVTSARVELVWDPPWDKNRMSEAARLELGLL